MPKLNLARPEQGTYILELGRIDNGVAYFSILEKKSFNYEGELEVVIDEEFKKEFGENVKIEDSFKMVIQHVGKEDYTLRIKQPIRKNKHRYVSPEKAGRKLKYYENKYDGV